MCGKPRFLVIQHAPSFKQGGYLCLKKDLKVDVKKNIAKCEDVCRTYHPIQKEYVKVLSLEDEIVTIR